MHILEGDSVIRHNYVIICLEECIFVDSRNLELRSTNYVWIVILLLKRDYQTIEVEVCVL
jgi:hypothetical protein